jgi:opacity protein-like surface antigen
MWMKNVILAAVLAVGVAGFVASSDAQEVKKLRPHPDAAADQAVQQQSVELPSGDATHPGGASDSRPKPKTGAAAATGGTSTSQSKKN